jgi:hypothetical protein
VRLAKWYNTYAQKDKNRIVREVSSSIPKRDRKQCNFYEYKDDIVAYRRYAYIQRPDKCVEYCRNIQINN